MLIGDNSRLVYRGPPVGMTVNLAVRESRGGETEGDRLTSSFQEIIGGPSNERLIGDERDNWFRGKRGTDTSIFDGDSLPGATGTLAGETDVVKDFSGLGADGVKQESEDGDKLNLSELTEDLAVKPMLTFPWLYEPRWNLPNRSAGSSQAHVRAEAAEQDTRSNFGL